MHEVELKFIFVGSRSILWGYWLPLFCTSCDLPHGFQSQAGSLDCTYLCMMNFSLRSSATPVFSTNRGTHCTSMYIAGLRSIHPSCKQWRAGSSGLQWDLISCCPCGKRTCYPTRPHEVGICAHIANINIQLSKKLIFHKIFNCKTWCQDLCHWLEVAPMSLANPGLI